MIVVLLLLLCCISAVIHPIASQCDNIDVKNVLKHLSALDDIALANGGNRAAGTSGYQASLGYVVSQLVQTNLIVSLQDFLFTSFRIIGTPSFAQTAPKQVTYNYPADFRVFTGSGSGVVNGIVTAVPNYGCSTADYVGFPASGIAVLSRGVCTFDEKIQFAVQASASAIIIYNSDQGGVFSSRGNANIPVFGVSAYLGLELTESEPVQLSINVETRNEQIVTTNVLAETPGGDVNKVILLGSHLDSVEAGGGINDNGSGSSTNLEVALTVARCLNPKNKIRFAWWAAEELGLLGSRHYVNDLSINNPNELRKIALNINIDMLGSPNFFYGIYNGSGAAPVIREKCIIIQKEFESFISSLSKPFQLTPFNGRSDYGPFIEVGIPAGGLFSGAEEVKNATGRSVFKGLANTPYDPCYHDYCDSYDNISEEGLDILARASYYVTTTMANNVALVDELLASRSLTKPDKPYMYQQHDDAISTY